MERSFASLRQLDHHDNSPVRIYPNNEPDDYPAHWHRKFEIILPVTESYAAIIDNHRYEMQPGEVLVIPSGVVHEILAPPEGTRYIFLVDHEVVDMADGLSAMQHFFYPCVHLRPETDGKILDTAVDYLLHAVTEHDKRGIMEPAAICAWIDLFLIHVARWLVERQETDESDRRQHMNETLLDVYAYITEHCSEQLTLDGIAAYSGYSKYHFARIFSEYTGMSFYEFFLRQRVMLCRQLLSEADLTMTEVASRAGFGSIATFNRVFKQYEGVTPTQYRTMRQRRR